MRESKLFALGPGALRPILTQEDFAAELRRRRQELQLTLAELDHRAGFHEGYAAHLEHPFTRSGKKSFKLTALGAVWLAALKLRLVLVPEEACASSALEANDNGRSLGTGTRTHVPPGSGGERAG